MGDEEEEASLGATRYPVMPSLVALQQMRNRLHLAYLGKKLMKWTALATGKELRRLSMEMAIIMKDYGVKMQRAFILLARTRYFVPGMNETVLETVPDQACVTVMSTRRSVSGVKVKNMHVVEMGCDSYQYVGMSRGGTAVKECKQAWLDLVKLMVLLCQFRVTFELIDTAHKNATKKQNVLSRCIIPRIIITMRYILSELDEMEREESFRLKRFKQLKYKNKKVVSHVDHDTEEEEPKIPKPKPVPEPEPVPKLQPVPEPEPVRKPEPVREPEPVRKPEPIPEPEPVRKPEPQPTPIIIPEPSPLELLMTHINEVVRLAEHLENEPIPQTDIGLTICDLRRLKVELKNLIELSEAPNQDRVCTTCMKISRTVSPCPHQETPKPVQTDCFETPKSDGLKTAMNLMPRFKEKMSIPEYILKPQPLTAASEPLELQAMSTDRIEQLEKHVDEVIRMTNHYQCEGLLSKSVEDFIRCCKSVKIKIKESKCQKQVRAKLDRLKEQVTHLQKITNIVQTKDLSATTVTSFISCCEEFRAKLDRLKSCRGPPTVSSIEKLLNRIDYSIELSKEAKVKGLVNESLEEFIKSCNEIKLKIKPKPQAIGDLLLNLNDIINFIKKYKDDALISDSIETFYKRCQTTKAKLDSYKLRPARGSEKSVCSKTPPKTPQPESISCPCAKTSSQAPWGNSCSTGNSVPSKQGTTSTCGQLAEKQQSQHSCTSQSLQDSDTLCTEFTCVHKKPSTRSCKSYKTVPPEKSKSVESTSNASVKIIVIPKEGKKKGPKASIIENTTTTVRRYKEIDGSIVEEKEIVIVKERVQGSLQKQPSKTSSCGSCGSGKSTKRVNLCEVPVTKGFRQSVRNIKSETLIRSLDLSTSYPPFLWSSVSANTLISLERSNAIQTVEQDPFFCASPTTSNDDSVLPMCS